MDEIKRHANIMDAPVGIAVFDIHLNLIDANPRFAEMLGYSLKQLISRSLLEFAHADDIAKYKQMSAELLSNRTSIYQGETRYVNKNGETVWAYTCTLVQRGEQREETFGIAMVNNIAVYQQEANKLRQSEGRFRMSLMHSPVVVFEQDLELRYTWVYNPRNGLTVEDVLGRSDWDLLSREDAGRLAVVKRQVMTSGVGKRQEVLITIDGQLLYYDTTIEPLRDESGEIAGITVVSFDITERKQTEAALARARNEWKPEEMNEDGLTLRELAVLRLIAEGKSDKEIAFALAIQVTTASKHVHNILAKMQVGSRTEASVKAVRAHLIA